MKLGNRITNEEKYNKYNYNKKESDNYRRPKFYGKIKTNNEDYKPGKNYEEKEKEKNEEEPEEENIEKPQFINSQLKENKEENITELKNKKRRRFIFRKIPKIWRFFRKIRKSP